VSEENKENEGEIIENQNINEDYLNVFIIVCIKLDENNRNYGEDIERQLVQTTTLLKTIFLLTSKPVNVFIINNDENLFTYIVKHVKGWGVEADNILRLKSQGVVYPAGLGQMVNMFRICATARLFIHEMLPSVDAGIYLDSDILLMDNIVNLWSFFSKFNSAQVMGLAAVEFSYSRNVKIPHFGPPGVGLNAGVILMNLTRMRDMSGGGFTGSVRWVYNIHRRQLTMADQDILNAIFGYSPWYLYELPCSWNYILWQCREMPEAWYGSNMRGDKNMCPGAQTDGISLLHGNHASFTTDFDIIFRHVFEFIAAYDMQKSILTEVEKLLRNILIETVANRTDSNKECSAIEGIEDMMVKRIALSIVQKKSPQIG